MSGVSGKLMQDLASLCYLYIVSSVSDWLGISSAVHVAKLCM